ncbi:hypothetical protein IE81DRAFT_368206 [Ceraceosorus guamensis]|uniref:Uncharacterized protein n=1 Tax=Ceraceosorus guamensis TaxID=1522189 RepID=A0A316VSC9_9BASI|nr:hypothetical protein IE81DRAFT_368206 [Ceraceosorus guamensis]PWN40539.1 hypothetical protein IE81DRAFT_368206 [Ceraceosorus guamensis]
MKVSNAAAAVLMSTAGIARTVNAAPLPADDFSGHHSSTTLSARQPSTKEQIPVQILQAREPQLGRAASLWQKAAHQVTGQLRAAKGLDAIGAGAHAHGHLPGHHAGGGFGPSFSMHPGHGTTNIHIHSGGGTAGLAAAEERLLGAAHLNPAVPAKGKKRSKLPIIGAALGGGALVYGITKMGEKGHDQKVAQDAAEAQMQQDDEAYKAQQDEAAKQQQQQAPAAAAAYPASYPADPGYAYADPAATTPAPAPTTPAPSGNGGGKGKSTPQRRSLIEVSSLDRRSYDVGGGFVPVERRGLASAGEEAIRLVHVGHDERWGPHFRTEKMTPSTEEARGRGLSRAISFRTPARTASLSPEPLLRKTPRQASGGDFLSAHSSPFMTPERVQTRPAVGNEVVSNGVARHSEIEEAASVPAVAQNIKHEGESTQVQVKPGGEQIAEHHEHKTVADAATEREQSTEVSKVEKGASASEHSDVKKKKKKLPWKSMLVGGAAGLYISRRDLHESLQDSFPMSGASAELALHPRTTPQGDHEDKVMLLSKRTSSEGFDQQQLAARDGAEAPASHAPKQPSETVHPAVFYSADKHESPTEVGKHAPSTAHSNIAPNWGQWPGQHVGRAEEYEALVRDHPKSNVAQMGYIPSRYNFERINSKSEPFQKFATLAGDAVRHEQSAKPKLGGSFGGKGLALALVGGGIVGGLLSLPRPDKRSVQDIDLDRGLLQARSTVDRLAARSSAFSTTSDDAAYYIVPRTSNEYSAPASNVRNYPENVQWQGAGGAMLMRRGVSRDVELPVHLRRRGPQTVFIEGSSMGRAIWQARSNGGAPADIGRGHVTLARRDEHVKHTADTPAETIQRVRNFEHNLLTELKIRIKRWVRMTGAGLHWIGGRLDNLTSHPSRLYVPGPPLEITQGQKRADTRS